MTIAKLGANRAEYYISTVARGIEDYYAGHGEAPGSWRGAAAVALGLSGTINDEVLRDLIDGRLPDGTVLAGAGRSGRARTPGWDLTFSAPKSVSVLFGLAEPAVSRQVVDAHEAAVNESLAWLDRWAVMSRRRRDGTVVAEAGTGMLVAGFRHRTSRAGDPQLHTHCLAANAVQRDDGTWGALNSRTVYRNAKTAGYVYQAVLRSELTRRLGIEWGPVANGVAELVDVPDALRELFSTRRREIEAELDARGASSARAAQIAAVRTRAAKRDVANTDVLRGGWRTQARTVGVQVGDIERGVGTVSSDARLQVSRRERRFVTDALLDAHGLTEKRTSFGRGEVTRAWCERIDPRTVHITSDTIDDLVDDTVADRRSVLLGAGDTRIGNDPRRWSTSELLLIEASILQQVADGRGQRVAVVPAGQRHATVRAHPTLSGEQANMVETLTGAGHAIDAVVGVAGSGKTYALAVAHKLWRDAGYQVIGAAVAGRTAKQLQDDSGIASTTLDRLLLHLGRADSGGLGRGTVVVVDETGMVPTRNLARLLDHCGKGVKVVLVGDHHQLPEIDAGGVLRGIVDRYGDEIAVLRENRRQHNIDERAALAELRDGDTDAALDWYIDTGRVHIGADARQTRRALIDTWWAERGEGPCQLLMAERRRDVRHLNTAVRERLAAAGELGSERLVVGERDFAVGDTVMFGHNDRIMNVRNGDRGVITALDTGARSLTIDVPGQRPVRVDARYLDDGHLDYGYAATVHKYQGATGRSADVLTSDSTNREHGYVALSRGRDTNRIWTTADNQCELDVEPHGTDEGPDTDPIANLRHAMARSNAQQLATDLADDVGGIDL